MPNLPPRAYATIAIVIVLLVLSWMTYHYHSLYVEGQIQNKVLYSKNKELAANIQQTNVALEKLAKDSLDRELNAKKALEAAEKKNKQLMKQAQEFLTAMPSDVNMCVSANILYNKYLERQ